MRVVLERADGHVTLLIADDGKGFDKEKVDGASHFGLRGMQERVEMLGGELQVASAKGKGTVVQLNVKEPALSGGTTVAQSNG